ncbi:exostosin family protein [Flavobacterium sp. ACN6]|uniref:exostosin domain-containing protein n=1 Tax=Flavobacterium sp. ACN6 TaxID=1920426 RepID=UPI000BB30230|nr:exostosin family protein [Flavobacterium sp. ACN6]PBJ13833.1 Exostosin family protein [Flavobacterium sp. ACN6]
MLKIYTDHNFLNEENRKKIFPLLFDIMYIPNEKSMSNFILTNSLSEADVAIFPVDIVTFLKNDKNDFFQNWTAKVSEYNIPIWTYAAGDLGFSVKHKNAITFRLGGFNSKLSSSSFILPCFVNDPYAKILKNDFFTLPKETKPSIGFVGNANGSFLKLSKEFALYLRRNLINFGLKYSEDYHPFYPVGQKRHKLLNKVENFPEIESNFIFRNKYRAREKGLGSQEKTTLEFFKNIQNNLYTLCLRGNGNFSVRFYETLIMGRIPVLIDTDVRLPMSDQIDWRQHCLIVSENSITADLILFHASKTEDELREMQKNNRKLILERLNRIDYFIQIANIKSRKK